MTTNRLLNITRFETGDGYWRVETFWRAEELKLMSSIRVRRVENLLACVALVAERDDYRISVHGA